MKLFALSLIMAFITIASESAPLYSDNSIITCSTKATCLGKSPCNACKNCNACKHCNSGGTCGVCAVIKKKTETKQPAKTIQCKAITKKGTRCLRNASENGKCWQHI